MVGHQISMFEMIEDLDPVPELWECMKTCRHADEYTDLFPDTNIKRCNYGFYQPGIGTSGKDIVQKVINNTWHAWCIFYDRS